MLPQLRELEHGLGGEVAIVGVHSAKFMAEKATENLREAVVRYGIDHPVVNDRDFEVWNSYSVRAWPTLMFVDPRGRVFAKHEGEAPLEALAAFCRQALADYRAEGLIDTSRPLPVRVESEATGELAFPGKLAVDCGRLAIADTNHDRVLLASTDGAVRAVYDGFARPQGVCFEGDILYVAETGAHALRSVNLGSGEIRRLGDGLRSPWDVAVAGGDLYVAMAGTHQVWRARGRDLSPFAGSGREGIQDGAADGACLAQPSGLASASGRLYVADSEVSGIREIALPGGEVRTLVGTGLFDFGDSDGPAAAALLQHPLAVAAGEGFVYIADSYNHKLKRLDPGSSRVETIAGTGEAGFRDGEASHTLFNEPAGLACEGSLLYVADTNNHRIRVLDLSSRQVRTLELSGL